MKEETKIHIVGEQTSLWHKVSHQNMLRSCIS